MLTTRTDGSRLLIREGGGALSFFGVPFALAGVLLWAALLDVVHLAGTPPVFSGSGLAMAFMGTVFVLVGVGVTGGRRWLVADVAERTVLARAGVLVPLTRTARPLSDFSAVGLTRTRGDSDTAESFDVTLVASAGSPMRVARSTDFAEARACAASLAAHLSLPVQDGTTDSPVTLRASDVNRGLASRLVEGDVLPPRAERPPTLRSDVELFPGGVRLRLPNPPPRLVLTVLALLPSVIPLLVVPSLRTFFVESHTPTAIGNAFIGFLIIGFVVVPTVITVAGYLRARYGSTSITVRDGRLTVTVRALMRTTTQLDVPLTELLAVDVSTGASLRARVQADVRERLAADGAAASHLRPDSWAMRMIDRIGRAAQGHGLVLKTRAEVTELGGWLDDDEVVYLAAVLTRSVLAASRHEPVGPSQS